MRKLLFILMFFCLIVLGLNAVSATYYGETPTALNGSYEGYYEIKFLESGTFVEKAKYIQVLVVAGGGGSGKTSGRGGGAGAGGLIYMDGNHSYEASDEEMENGIIVIVGAGGAAATENETYGQNGLNSSFGRLVALGGGGGSAGAGSTKNGLSGGSGSGGAAWYSGDQGLGIQSDQAGDSGTYGHGHDGGFGRLSVYDAGGGGGAGDDGDWGAYGCHGGAGLTIWGFDYAGGGGGGSTTAPGNASHGGGNGSLGVASAGTINTGGGAGGGTSGGSGGSGIVVVRYVPDLIYFSNPTNASTVNAMKILVVWDLVADADYNIRWSTNSSFSSSSSATYSDEYAYLYLANGDWYFDGRSVISGEYSEWAKDWLGVWTFTANNKPTFDLPNIEEYSPYVDFNWTDIDEVTHYELEVYSDETLTTLAYSSEPSYNEDTILMDEGSYWARVRGVDDYMNGTWSDTFAFTLDIEDIPFIYTMNSVNYYGGDTMLYEFTGLDTNVTYTFNINRLTDLGAIHSTIATKTVVGDEVGEGSFDYVIPSSAYYPFEVRYVETNSQLLKHYAAPRPSTRFYQAAEHKLNYSETVLAVGIGDVVYNNKSGFLHTNTLPTQCLYTYGDYFLLHYNFEWQEGVKFWIMIFSMDTGSQIAAIHSDDLYTFNHELGYAEQNFVVIPTNGTQPVIVDDYNLLLEYEGDDWNTLTFPKGAYAYILVEDSLDSPNLAFGESVLLVGDSDVYEWKITPSAASVAEGQAITWTITCNTEGIWDSYKLMRFYDTAADTYYIGTAGSPYYVTYPASYAETFALNYDTNPALGYVSGGTYGVKPSDVPTDAYQYEWMTFDLPTTYNFILSQGYTITEIPDLTDDLDDWLSTSGLGTAQGKLLLAMIIIIILVVFSAMMHVPVAGIALIALSAFVALIAIGFIPIWTTIILGLALVLFLVRLFSGGGGGE